MPDWSSYGPVGVDEGLSWCASLIRARSLLLQRGMDVKSVRSMRLELHDQGLEVLDLLGVLGEVLLEALLGVLKALVDFLNDGLHCAHFGNLDSNVLSMFSETGFSGEHSRA